MPFQLFDPSAELRITHGNLPHWLQPGATYFVTFRTDDSVPAELARQWHLRRREWFVQQGLDLNRPWRISLAELPEDVQKEYHATFTREFMEYLDQGMGACVLRRQELATIVGDSLHHFDGVRYHLGDFVVMPNHVHGIIILNGNDNQTVDNVETTHALSPRSITPTQPPATIGQQRFQNQGKNTLSSIIGSYKSAVTKHCNRLGFGFAWQPRFHDHIIRDDASFQNISTYIQNNPSKWSMDKFYL